MVNSNTSKTNQSARRRKASLVADQLVEVAVGTPDITNGVPAAAAVLARPAARCGLLLGAATLALLTWRAHTRR
ncbi:hypothetical protein ACFWBH_35870 [Streptomyces sp. NPDC059999]|uniref:hypothetical protein n=1 Tax=Streptomyces sp. NPDC059999 TaxID=3347030 RepID=UPI0036C863CC